MKADLKDIKIKVIKAVIYFLKNIFQYMLLVK